MAGRASKNKGVSGQNEVRERLRAAYPYLKEGDITCRGMGQNGTDIILSPHAEQSIPFDIEVKRTERLNIYATIEQAEENTKGDRVPLIAFRKNRQRWWAAVPLEWLLQVLTQERGGMTRDDALRIIHEEFHRLDRLEK